MQEEDILVDSLSETEIQHFVLKCSPSPYPKKVDRKNAMTNQTQEILFLLKTVFSRSLLA